MTVLINGVQHGLTNTTQLSELLAEMGYEQGFAVARNGEFVPRAMYSNTMISDGDEIEVVTPMQGG